MNANDKPTPKLVPCLGWCGKKFMSPHPCYIRFCHRCRAKRDSVYLSPAVVRGDKINITPD